MLDRAQFKDTIPGFVYCDRRKTEFHARSCWRSSFQGTLCPHLRVVLTGFVLGQETALEPSKQEWSLLETLVAIPPAVGLLKHWFPRNWHFPRKKKKREENGWRLGPAREELISHKEISQFWQLLRQSWGKDYQWWTTCPPGRHAHLSIPCALCLNLNFMSGPWRCTWEEEGRCRWAFLFVPLPSAAVLDNNPPPLLRFSALLVCSAGPWTGAEPALGLPGLSPNMPGLADGLRAPLFTL